MSRLWPGERISGSAIQQIRGCIVVIGGQCPPLDQADVYFGNVDPAAGGQVSACAPLRRGPHARSPSDPHAP